MAQGWESVSTAADRGPLPSPGGPLSARRRHSRYGASMFDAQERFLASGPLRICTERVGDPGLLAVLMIMGLAAQGVSCPDALVGRLVERGVRVIASIIGRPVGRSSVVDF